VATAALSVNPSRRLTILKANLRP